MSAMTNVAMLNFGFGIPVKVFSVHLIAMSIFVLGGDFARLANFLLLDRPTSPSGAGQSGRGNRFRGPLKAAFLLYVFGTSVQACFGIHHQQVSRSPLYGIYNVEEFTANGSVRPPLTTDAFRWKTVIFSRPESIWIKRMNDSVQTLPAEYDASKGVLTISGKSKTDPKTAMSCARPDREHLTLSGTLGNQMLVVKLTRFDESKFKLGKSR